MCVMCACIVEFSRGDLDGRPGMALLACHDENSLSLVLCPLSSACSAFSLNHNSTFSFSLCRYHDRGRFDVLIRHRDNNGSQQQDEGQGQQRHRPRQARGGGVSRIRQLPDGRRVLERAVPFRAEEGEESESDTDSSSSSEGGSEGYGGGRAEAVLWDGTLNEMWRSSLS